MSIVLGALRLTEIMTDAMEGFVASPKIAGATNSAIIGERPLLSVRSNSGARSKGLSSAERQQSNSLGTGGGRGIRAE